jgi:FkbM family methyltransferase
MPAEDNVDELVFDTFFKGRSDGIFVEIGAARPDYLSVSALFRAKGWRVLAVEPNPEFCAQHTARGYSVLEYACGEEDRDNVDFYVVDSNGVDYLGGKVTAESLSSLGIKDEFVELYERSKHRISMKKILVKLRRLDTILRQHAPDVTKIDMLCADVEGWELTVLKGFSLDKYSPSVVILENLFRKPEYPAFMEKAGYALWLDIGHNEVYIRRDLRTAKIKAVAVKAKTQYIIRNIKQRVVNKLSKA